MIINIWGSSKCYSDYPKAININVIAHKPTNTLHRSNHLIYVLPNCLLLYFDTPLPGLPPHHFSHQEFIISRHPIYMQMKLKRKSLLYSASELVPPLISQLLSVYETGRGSIPGCKQFLIPLPNRVFDHFIQ